MSFRRDYITKPIFSWARGVLPPMSDTEREALEAGDVWWDADLFTGNPDWSKLLAYAPADADRTRRAPSCTARSTSSARCSTSGRSTGNGAICRPRSGPSSSAKKFFGMIIPKEFGGLGFSPYAHSEVVRKISSRSLTAAVTVMVPNSLGPGELLMRFGTKEQQDRWLPRLADGRDIPCFGLTSPEAGSDAASMIDTGIICKGNFEGREVLGLRLNWHKRYITLGPVATLLGLAFKAYDPDHLVGTAGRARHHRRADPDPSARRRDRPPPSAGDAGVPERPELGPATSSSRSTTSSAGRSGSARAGRC